MDTIRKWLQDHTMAGFSTPTAGAGQGTANPSRLSHEPRFEAPSLQPTEGITQARVKEEYEHSQSHPLQFPEKTEPMKGEACSHVLEALMEKTTERLEPLATLATKGLEKLITPLDKVASTSDANRALRTIKELLQRSLTARTITGVVGETGAGKSSLINALLGEQRLLPTNGMRACTAVVTEISWNDSDKPEELYKAEIELVTRDEWVKEMEHLISDLLDTDGDILQGGSSKNTEASIALAKIQSVYPDLDKSVLRQSDARKLAYKKGLRDILGTTVELKAESAQKLYQQVKPYMDSNDNAKGRKATEDEHPAALWPLTKVVRLYTKADVLSTGVVLVDLPGCGDSNAARGAVAAKYMQKCTSIWVVAPIIRAVDNKLAQHLLGESFKMQMKFDGNYTNITFVCSRTDGLNVEEMADSLGLGGSLAKYQATEKSTNNTVASGNVDYEKLQSDLRTMQSEIKNIEKDITKWQKMEVQAAQGKPVFAPVPKGNKRKSTTDQDQPARKQRRSTRARPITIDIDDDEDDLQVNDADSQQALTVTEVQETIRSLVGQKDSLSEKIKVSDKAARELDDRMTFLEEQLEQQRLDLKSESLRRRNEQSRSTIQQDFARGLKMIDQDTAGQGEDDSYDPQKLVRDYEVLAAELPVYCVSSHEYQKKCGRLRTQGEDDGFATVEDTEIPQLLEHAKKSTEVNRVQNYKKFLNNSLQVLQSLWTWTAEAANESIITEDEVKVHTQDLDQDLTKLGKDLKSSAEESILECKKIMKKNLFNKFKPVVAKAAKEVLPITQNWATAKNDNGRQLYAATTYKAVMRRRGYFKKGDREIDFNEELATPLKRKLAHDWEVTFSQQIPQVLDHACDTIERLMVYFHDALAMRIQGTPIASRVKMLEPQLHAHIQSIRDQQGVYRSDIDQKQREANRGFTPEVQGTMAEAYDRCAQVTGKGGHNRIKKMIDDHVRRNDRQMFDTATKQVQRSLNKMSNEHQKDLAAMVTNVLDIMTSDYRNCITKRDISPASLMVRREIMGIISKIDDEFRLKMTPKFEEDTSVVTTNTNTRNDLKPEAKASSNDNQADAFADTVAMDIDNSTIADHVIAPAQDGVPGAVEQPITEHTELANASEGLTDAAAMTAKASQTGDGMALLPEVVSNEPASSSQKPEEGSSITADQVMLGGTDP